MTTIYVRLAGNDTTGTGATATPYLTVKKALSVAVTGDRILIGDGTYAEDSGSGYLLVSQAFTGTGVIVAPESGFSDRVTITGTGTAWAVIMNQGGGITFDRITFQAQNATVQAAVRLTGVSHTKLRFRNCRFVTYSSTSATNLCVTTAWTTAASAISGVSFVKCRFDQIDTFNADGMLLDNAGTGSTATGIEIRDCVFNVGGFGMRLLGLTGVKVTGNEVETWADGGGRTGFQIGVDGSAGVLCSGLVAGNRFRSINGHGTVLGVGCDGVWFVGNTVAGGDNTGVGQGLVVKGAVNTRVQRNTIHGGYLSGLYFKGASDCQAIDNIVYNDNPSSPALRVGINDDGTAVPNQRLTIRRNTFVATAGTVLGFGGATDDSGGSYVDENVYVVTGTATLGSVRGTTVTTLTGLRAAWSGYDRTVNDRNSKIGAKHPPFAGLPFADLPV